jgi:hypothetical protein
MHLGHQDDWCPVLGSRNGKSFPGGLFVKNVFQEGQNEKTALSTQGSATSVFPHLDAGRPPRRALDAVVGQRSYPIGVHHLQHLLKLCFIVPLLGFIAPLLSVGPRSPASHRNPPTKIRSPHTPWFHKT